MTKRFEGISPARRILLLLTCGVVVLLLAGGWAFLHAGTWLVREDPLQKSRSIVVLSGGLPERALGAAEIYREGYAQEVWLTQPLQPSARMEDLQLPYAGEQEYSSMVLIAKGVLPGNIRILKPRITNTVDELQAVAKELGAQPAGNIIVVTSKAHTRRVHVLWNSMAQGRGRTRLIVRAASQDSFDPEHWWRTSNDALTVVREYLGLMNAWAGLPLHHAR
jgi:uncharacterized SAM-binding protein YcdF (DUF218 family)